MANQLIFWGALLVLLLACARHAWRSRRRPRPTLLDKLALVVAAALLCLVFFEAVVRWRGGTPARAHGLVGCPTDDRLGWICKAVDGDLRTRRPRALVVGDSFTFADGVPEARVYYRPLADDLGLELWVRAGGGWGTLQELLALDRVIDQVHPDLVVLQICSNDFINNSWELENASLLNNNMSLRPYWERGAVVMRYPERWLGPAQFLTTRSALATQLVARAHVLRAALAARGRLASVEYDIGKLGRDYLPWRRAEATTDELVGALVRRAAPARVVAVPVDDIEPQLPVWRTILERHGVALCEQGLARLRLARQAGEAIFQADGAHWNEQGHRYVGRALSAWLQGLPADFTAQPLAADLEGRGGVNLVWEQESQVTAASLRGSRVESRSLVTLGARQHLFGLQRLARGVWQVGLHKAGSGSLVLRELQGGRLVAGEKRVAIPVPGPPGAALFGLAADGGHPCVVWHDVSRQCFSFRRLDPREPEPDRVVCAPLPPGAQFLGAPDLDGDGQADLAWADSAGRRVTFWRRGARLEPQPSQPADSAWIVEAVTGLEPSPERPTARAALVWRHASGGRRAVWYLDASGRRVAGSVYGP